MLLTCDQVIVSLLLPFSHLSSNPPQSTQFGHGQEISRMRREALDELRLDCSNAKALTVRSMDRRKREATWYASFEYGIVRTICQVWIR
jgi:hypothetical protein